MAKPTVVDDGIVKAACPGCGEFSLTCEDENGQRRFIGHGDPARPAPGGVIGPLTCNQSRELV